MRLLNNLLTSLLGSGRSSQLKMDDDSLLEGIARESIEPARWHGIPYQVPFQKGLRLLLLLATLITLLAFILHYSLVYVTEVLLAENQLSVNREGAFMPRKSFGREYGLFLFNTSDLWANTGIRIGKGDRVRISASGAFHSSLEDLRRDAQSNKANPEIRWVGQKLWHPHGLESQPGKEAYGIYQNGGKAQLGTLLYSVVPEYARETPVNCARYASRWRPSVGRRGFTARNNGILHLAVNDIYFQDATALEEYCQAYPTRFDAPFEAQAVLDAASESHTDYSRIFYDDNLGQILVCMEIQHPLKARFFSTYLNPRQAFRWMESGMDRAFDNHRPVMGMILSVGLVVGFIVWITLIMGITLLTVLAGLYLLMLAGYWVSLLWRDA